MIYKTLHRKLKIAGQEPLKNPEVFWNGNQFLFHIFVFFDITMATLSTKDTDAVVLMYLCTLYVLLNKCIFNMKRENN